MWLALFAALFQDTGEAAARRAANRETARRLGIEADTPVPGTRARLEALMRKVQADGLSTFDVQALQRVVQMAWLDPPARSIRDAEEVYLDRFRFVLPLPGRRGPLDPYLTWLYTVGRADRFDWDEARAALPGFLDWANATRPNLSGMSWRDAMDAVDAWHAQFALHRSDEAPSPGVVVARFSDGARIERLITRDQLSDEGDAMGHCVGSHYASVAAGDTQVFSYRDPNGMPKATWEIQVHAEPNDFERGAVLDLEGPQNEDVRDRSAEKRVPAWLRVHRIEIGEFSQKVAEEEAANRLIPSAWLPEKMELSEEEAKLDAQVEGLVEDSRFYGGPGKPSATTYMRGVLSGLQEEQDSLDAHLRILRIAEHLDDDDELQVHLLESIDPEWTPAKVLETIGTREAWARDGARLMDLGRAIGVKVDPTDPEDLSNFVYRMRFAAQRALRYAADREALAEAFGDNDFLTASKEVAVERAVDEARQSEARVYALLKNALRALYDAINLNTHIEKDDSFADFLGDHGIATFHGPVPDSETGGYYEIELNVERDKARYNIYWVSEAEREWVGERLTLLEALAHAALIISVKDWLKAESNARALLQRHGLEAELSADDTYAKDLAVLVAAADAKGLPVPPSVRRRIPTR